MISADATTAAALEARVKGMVYLVEGSFLSGTLRFNTSAENLTIDGQVYTGLGKVTEISAISESEDQTPNKLVMKFSLADSSMLYATIGNAAEYRGRPIRVYLQVLDGEMQPAGSKRLRWYGDMNKVSTDVSASASATKAALRLECTRPGLARIRHFDGHRITHQQHTKKHPNDRGLEYLDALVNTPQPWLTYDFQKIE